MIQSLPASGLFTNIGGPEVFERVKISRKREKVIRLEGKPFLPGISLFGDIPVIASLGDLTGSYLFVDVTGAVTLPQQIIQEFQKRAFGHPRRELVLDEDVRRVAKLLSETSSESVYVSDIAGKLNLPYEKVEEIFGKLSRKGLLESAGRR